jgi:transcriptional regulator with XRE-family HTH domain/predicted negative regulator of RcsB-dependent stress response
MPRQKSRHIDDPKRLGARLRALRLEKGLSQRDLSFTGCTAAYVSRIEAGERVPSLQLLREFARILGTSADYLATGEAEASLAPLDEADLMLRLGNTEQAEAAFTLAAQSADSFVRARGQSGLGVLAYETGRIEEAVELLQDARESAGARWPEVANGPEMLVRALALSGRLEEAIATSEQLVKETPETDMVGRERAQVLLANALIDNGSFDRAGEVLASAMADEAPPRDPVRLAQILWSQSRLHSVRGEPDLASTYARRALAVIELTEHVAYAARARLLMAYIENERSEPTQALEILDAGWTDVVQSNDPYLAVVYRIERARALIQLERTDEARDLAIEVLAATEGLGSIDAARAFSTLAGVLAATGEEEHALQAYESAAEQLEKIGSPLAGDVYTNWSELLDRLGRRDEAYTVLRRAVNRQRARRSLD